MPEVTAPDRIREPLIDEQGNVNSGVARVRCVSLARAVVELMGALDNLYACCDANRTAIADVFTVAHWDRLAEAKTVLDRQRSRFDL